MRVPVAVIVLLLSACGDYPVLAPGSAAARQAGYPDLLPHDVVTAALSPGTDAENAQAALAARAAALRRRAAWLRQQGMTEAERDALLP